MPPRRIRRSIHSPSPTAAFARKVWLAFAGGLPQIDAQQTIPLLYLLTSTGYPYEGTVVLADQKVTLNIAPAQVI